MKPPKQEKVHDENRNEVKNKAWLKGETREATSTRAVICIPFSAIARSSRQKPQQS